MNKEELYTLFDEGLSYFHKESIADGYELEPHIINNAKELFHSIREDLLLEMGYDIYCGMYQSAGEIVLSLPDGWYQYFLDIRVCKTELVFSGGIGREISLSMEYSQECTNTFNDVLRECSEYEKKLALERKANTRLINNGEVIACNETPSMSYYFDQIYLKVNYLFKYLTGQLNNNK